MFQTIQCSMSSVPCPTAASTSCAMTTKLVVLSGTLLHASGGDTDAPACVYLTGIVPPSLHAVVVNDIVWIGPRRTWGFGGAAAEGGAAAPVVNRGAPGAGVGFGRPLLGACCVFFHAS